MDWIKIVAFIMLMISMIMFFVSKELENIVRCGVGTIILFVYLCFEYYSGGLQ